MTSARIVALELSAKQARLGHARLVDKNNLHFVVGDVGRLPCPDNMFHAVIRNFHLFSIKSLNGVP